MAPAYSPQISSHSLLFSACGFISILWGATGAETACTTFCHSQPKRKEEFLLLTGVQYEQELSPTDLTVHLCASRFLQGVTLTAQTWITCPPRELGEGVVCSAPEHLDGVEVVC